MNLEIATNQAVYAFLSRVTALAHRAANDVLSVVLGRELAAVTAAQTSLQPSSRGRRVRRGQAQLSALKEKFAAFVRDHPGLRIEQINKQLGTRTKDLALPIRQLLGEGAIQRKFQKRSTIYFANAQANTGN